MNRFTRVCALLFLTLFPAVTRADVASWVKVKSEDAKPSGTVVYHKRFNVDFNIEEAYFKFTCYTIMDSAGTRYHAIVNGAEGAACSYWPDVQYMNLSKALRSGDNDIDIEVTWTPTGVSGPVVAKLFVTGKDKDGKPREMALITDDTWQYSIGKWVPQKDPGRSYSKVEVVAPADSWASAKNALVLPKINTSTVVGVTGCSAQRRQRRKPRTIQPGQ